jgi:hypothetical protein
VTVPTLQRIVRRQYKKKKLRLNKPPSKKSQTPQNATGLSSAAVPCSAAAAIKNRKTSAKRWKDFNRQAARREKAVELSVCENGLKIRERQ